MKNFLRKLHIGEGSGDGGSSPPPPPSRKGGGGGIHHHPHHEQRQQPSAVSSWLDNVPSRPPPPIPVEAEGPTSPSSVQTGAEERSSRQSEASERRRSQEEEMARERRRSREEDEVEERVIRESSEAEERKREREKEEDDLEEFQLQLVLEMSARDNPEEMEIEVAKQISLGFCPPQSPPAEVLAVRYWSFNALTYDDKISDGFYDLFFIGNGPASVTVPSLVELRAQPFSHKVNWEAVLVNRGEDHELMKLEQEALNMAPELRSSTSESVGKTLVQRLASLVASHMGGLVFDPESMLVKYKSMISSLRTSTGSVVVPLGLLKIGLARHRALLFKVLADSLNVPCRLLKGRQYTGSDDGALNIVKFNDGREFIVDLVADPGTLIPSDGAVLSTEFEENFASDNQHFNKDDATNHLGSSLSGVSSSACGSFEYELLDRRSTSSNVGPSYTDVTTTSQTSNQQNMLSSSFEKLSVSTCTSENRPIVNESISADDITAAKTKVKSVAANGSSLTSPTSEVGSAPAVRRMKVKDISEYMINAARENPQLAQKIHEVLLENGVVAPPDLFSEDSMEEPKDLIVYDTTLFQSKDEMKRRMNEIGSREYADRGHGPTLPHPPGHEFQTKVVPHRAPLESLKPVEGLGIYHPRDIQDIASPFVSQYEPSALPQEAPSPLTKQLPVTAAAVATAAVVASSMVVAAAKSNSDVNFDVPVAAAATVTAAAVFATTAAVSKQYEHLEPGNPLLSSPISSQGNESIDKGRDDFWNKQHLEIDHDQDNTLDQEVPQEAERISDKSSGTESARSDIALDREVAEFEIQWEEIAIGERIGLGSFGEVYRGDWHGTEVAVKKFLQQDISSDGLEEFRTEVRIMKRLRHPNVVLFMGAITRVPNLSIVTEFLPRGSLFRLIHRPNNQLDERKRVRMALDVARGMNYLHNCTPVIVHRDLKSPNLLVDKNWVVKAEWMAPEVLRNEPSNEKCDVFSYGVILWELCTLLQPWEGMNAMQVVGAVGFQNRRLEIPDNVDPTIAEIIMKCWQTDPKLRPSFAEIMAALKPLLKNMTSNQAPRQRVQQTDE
ncbi:probable serine/threonine-protein kinase SIS8 isoform X2 [Phragmites australis]|uniref:probable serine/threonine-protein kinase SIS8 isoform X2 n=1 Tax=Phragmites australis TaxID=29695 RepID=UPI002D795957|nr:probable serine/threonine-protein kinase SIS8 isoform X2 [Phragmites australis]